MMEKVINNLVQEGTCSYDLYVLLLEKGFSNLKTFFKEKEFNYVDSGGNETSDTFKSVVQVTEEVIPSHALVKEWLRVNFGWYVQINYYPENDDYVASIIKVELLDAQGKRTTYSNFRSYSSPQEANEAGILYIITNLI